MFELRISDTDASAERLQVLPLWVDGHAYLTVTPVFGEVFSPLNGQGLRRFPVCGSAEIERSLASAQAGRTLWAGASMAERSDVLCCLGALLSEYGAHLAGLLVEESGQSDARARAEIEAVLASLQNAQPSEVSGVVAVHAIPAQPLFSALKLVIPLLVAGCAVIVLSSPTAPSVLFAFAELTARAGLPGGVFNVLHGDSQTWAAVVNTGVTIASAE